MENQLAAREAAVKAVEDTARRLEMLRECSADESKSFRELKGLIAELKDTWLALDDALATLDREEQRALRHAQQHRMSSAAGEFCKNAFGKKMRERTNGTLPLPRIAAPGDSAAEQFAAAVARRDFDAAESTLAPWLRDEWTASRLEEQFDRCAGHVADGFDLNMPPPAGSWEAGANGMRYHEVRFDSAAPIPDDVTEKNFIGWHVITILTEEEDEYLTNLGELMSYSAISVRTSDGDRVGYLRAAE